MLRRRSEIELLWISGRAEKLRVRRTAAEHIRRRGLTAGKDAVDFQISVDIAAAPDVVWSVMAHAERWHEWTPSVRGIRLLDSGPLRVGSRALIRQPKFPPAMWKVTALDSGRSFTWKSGMPGMWVYAHHSVEPIEGGARATLRLHYEGVIGRLMGRMTHAITNRYLGFEAGG